MKPSIGRTIIVVAPQASSNGSDRAPGVITRVWNDHDTRNEPAMVNATVFPDLSIPQTVGSITLYDSEEQAAELGEPGRPFAFWPARV